MKARTKLLLGVGIATVALVVPSSAMAIGHTGDVTGTGAPDLSVAITAPPLPLELRYSTPATRDSVVTVTSTSLSWTLQIRDQETVEQPGRMAPCVGEAAKLANPLQWSTDGVDFTPLTGTNATVKTVPSPNGLGLTLVPLTYRQTLDGETDEVAALDCYKLTTVFTVTDS